MSDAKFNREWNIHRVGEHGTSFQGSIYDGPFDRKRDAYKRRDTLNKKGMKFLACRTVQK